MSTYQEIFSIRSQLDSARQPSFSERLFDLGTRLEGATPYDCTIEVRRILMSCAPFSTGASGRRLSPSGPYLYRFCKLLDIVKFTTRWRGDNELSDKILYEALSVRSKEAEDTGGWFPLAEVAEGELTSARQFTWWSSHAVRKESIICDLHERGMTNERVNPFSILLRCSMSRISRMASIFQPSVLDGFDSAIFDPQFEGVDVSGNAISIEDPVNLKKGMDEYALRPLPVEAVDALPLYIPSSQRDHKIYEEDLLSSLKTYYMSGLKT
jgi:hypothetical protein